MAWHANAELFETLAAQAAPEPVGVAVRVRTAERRQAEWRPLSVGDRVPDNHRVRSGVLAKVWSCPRCSAR